MSTRPYPTIAPRHVISKSISNPPQHSQIDHPFFWLELTLDNNEEIVSKPIFGIYEGEGIRWRRPDFAPEKLNGLSIEQVLSCGVLCIVDPADFPDIITEEYRLPRVILCWEDETMSMAVRNSRKSI